MFLKNRQIQIWKIFDDNEPSCSESSYIDNQNSGETKLKFKHRLDIPNKIKEQQNQICNDCINVKDLTHDDSSIS